MTTESSSPSRFASERLAQSERGAVYVEFIIAFIPMFIFFLGMLQLAFMESGQLIVSMAAQKAVRAAVVQLDNPKVCLSGGSQERQNPFLGSGGATAPGAGRTSGNEVMDKIRAAAYLPLATLGPPAHSYPFLGNVLSGLNFAGEQTTRMLLGYFAYGPGAAAVWLMDEVGNLVEPAALRASLSGDHLITVHVHYVFPCIVPLARHIMCRPLYDMVGLKESVTRLKDRAQSLSFSEIIADPEDVWDEMESGVQQIEDRMDDSKELYSKLKRAETPALMMPWVFGDMRFVVLEAEAALPNQWASYAHDAIKKRCGEEVAP